MEPRRAVDLAREGVVASRARRYSRVHQRARALPLDALSTPQRSQVISPAMSEARLSLDEATAQLTAPGQMFETERAMLNGMELTVWKNAPANLRQILDLSLNHAARDFLVYEDRRHTFEEHYRVAATLATRLVELGVHKGDRIAIASRNLPEWVMAFWGSVVTGAVVVPLNAWWTTDELIYGLSDSGTTVLFVDEERLERVRPRLGELTELSTVVVLSDDLSRPTRLGEAHARLRVMTFADALGDVEPTSTPPEVDIEPDDDATMLYTSGTTGHPKGAVGSHRNVITNLMNLFFAGQRSALRFGLPDAGPAEQASGLLNISFFHATGCHAFMIPATAAGNKIVMMHHFDSRRALELIQSERITGIG